MIAFTFVQKVKSIVGCGTVSKVGELVKQEGFHKAFLVFDPGVKKAGLIQKVTDSLIDAGIDYAEFPGVLPNPPSDSVAEGIKLLRETECDCIIAIGGGSAIDTGKGINIVRFNDGEVLDYVTKPIENHCAGLIAIPTTSGTGSEYSGGAVITDSKTHLKMTIVSPEATCDYAILDPEMTAGMPRGLTMMTGLDAFSHALEGYTSCIGTPVTELVCEKIMETVFETLPLVLKDGTNMQARTRMQMASALGGCMLTDAGAHLGHALAHTIGAKFNIIHGAACAYGVPALLEWLAYHTTEKVKWVGKLLGAEYSGNETMEEIGHKAAEAFVHFRDEALGLEPIDRFINDSVSMDEIILLVKSEGCAALAPEPPTDAELETLVRKTIKR